MSFRAHPALLLAVLAAPLLAAPLLAAPAHAAGDPGAGKRVFAQCHACHRLDDSGKSSIGPNLHGVVGRRAGTLAGYRYSPASLAKGEAGLVWDEASLRAYLKNPRAFMPGTRMTFAGLRQDGQIDDLLAYLEQAGEK